MTILIFMIMFVNIIIITIIIIIIIIIIGSVYYKHLTPKKFGGLHIDDI